MSRKWLLTAMVVIFALGASGCPALMLGSLGYEGYEYEKTGTLPGMPSSTHSAATREANPRPTPSPEEIE
jgi:hypothetical protein